MKKKAGQTQSLNLTKNELKTVGLALDWCNYTICSINMSKRKREKELKTIEGVMAQVLSLLGNSHDEN